MKKKNIILTLTGITLSALILIGLTYAYYKTRIYGNPSNDPSISVQTEKLEIVYSDGTASVLQSDKVLIPSETLNKDTAIGIKEFTVTNTSKTNDTTGIPFSIIIDNVSIKDENGNTTTYEQEGFRYAIVCSTLREYDGEMLEDGCQTSEYEKFNYNDDYTEILSINYNNLYPQKFPVNGGILRGDTILPGETYHYTLIMWYEDTYEDQSSDMGKTYQARVNIADTTLENPYNNKSTLAYNVIENSIKSTNGTKFVSAPLSAVATEYPRYKYIRTEPTEYTTSDSVASDYYISYEDDYDLYVYKYRTTYRNGFALKNKDGSDVQTIKFSADMDPNLLDGKYIVYSTSETTAQKITDVSSIDIANNTITTGKVPVVVESGEKILFPVNDDYGTSYSFRGGVEDNFVLFNNLCWRILRIEGDGSIKLALEGDSGEETMTNCTNLYSNSSLIDDGSTRYHYGETYIKTKYNSTGSFFYTYLADYKAETDSASAALNNWFNEKFINEGKLTANGEKIKDDTWCLGGRFDDEIKGETVLSNDLYIDSMIANKQFSYPAGKRSTLRIADLTCGSKEEKVVAKIGTLTYDELVLAGAAKPDNGSPANNIISYIFDNTTERYWLLSKTDHTYTTTSTGLIEDAVLIASGTGYSTTRPYSYNASFALRPAITLKPDTTISGGEGTATNPYVIN